MTENKKVRRIKEPFEEVEKYFNDNFKDSPNGKFFIIKRSKDIYVYEKDDHIYEYAITFFDQWSNIIKYIKERNLKHDEITFYGPCTNDMTINANLCGELYKIKALNLNNDNCLNI